MKNDTLEEAYFIDNLPPKAKVNSIQSNIDDENNYSDIFINLGFEPLDKDTVTISIRSSVGSVPFDTVNFDNFVISEGQGTINLKFSPTITVNDIKNKISQTSRLEFNIFIDPDGGEEAGLLDLAGNQEPEIINIVIGN